MARQQFPAGKVVTEPPAAQRTWLAWFEWVGKSINGMQNPTVYQVAGLPSGQAGQMIYISDEAGGAVMAFYDGSAWRRVTDRAIVS